MEHRSVAGTAGTGRGISPALEVYLRAYRKLIAVEQVDKASVILSFPLHLASSHRIEITVTQVGKGRYILSDSGRTLGEIQDAGFSLSPQTRDRLERIAHASNLRIINDYLVLDTSRMDLGDSIQQFLEVSKVIGDVYLVHKQPPIADKELVSQVGASLRSENLLYRERERVSGALEPHRFDLFVPPNGQPGLAVSVLAGQSTHVLAQVWAYKCDDVRRNPMNRALKIAIVYDVRIEKWSRSSTSILRDRADIAIPGDALPGFPKQLRDQGVLAHRAN